MFRKKKGLAENIDWILGVALFLLVVGFTLTLFKPGIKSLYNNEDLLTIVQNGMEQNTNWNITKVPIFIEGVKKKMPGYSPTVLKGLNNLKFSGTIYPSSAPITSDEEGALSVLIKDLGLENNNVELFYVFDLGITPINDETNKLLDTNEGKARTKLIQIGVPPNQIDRNNGLSPNVNNLVLPMYLKNPPSAGTKTKHLLIYSSDILNLHSASTSTLTSTDKACKLNCESTADKTQCWTGAYNNPQNIFCSAAYELGVPEKIIGLSLAKFINLNSDPSKYDNLKTELGFPKEKDFLITLEIGNDMSIQFPEGTQVPLRANVYARRYNTVILNDDALTIPVTVRIQVW